MKFMRTVVLLVILILALVCIQQARAEEETLINLPDIPEEVVVTEEGNPLLEAFKEIINWTQANSIGLSGLYADGDLNVLASVQLAKSKHDWIHAGVSILPAEKLDDVGLGVYAGFNLAKLIEKIKGSELEVIGTLDLGYSAVCTFPEWKKGLFGLFLRKEI